MRNRPTPSVVPIALACAAALAAGACSSPSARVRSVQYNGWKCTELTNGRVDVVIAPQLGGRIIQLRLDGYEYLWVNRELEGKVQGPPAAGAALAGWANYGGDKLWPAPQGWSGPNEWPGPPDPYAKGGRTDGGAFTLEVLKDGPDEAAVKLVGPDDLYAGIRFEREIRLRPGSTSISLVSSMQNIVDRRVRWGIWENAQQDARLAAGKDGSDVRVWAPIERGTKFPRGYEVMFGPRDNPQFAVDDRHPTAGGGKLFTVTYDHRVGKAALDRADWVALTHEKSAHLFAQTFRAFPDREHPDGASVEIWTSGPGRIRMGGKDVDLTESEPWLVETEVLSPYFDLAPGQSASFPSMIHLGHANGPVVEVKAAMAVLEPVHRGPKGIAGRVVVFRDGRLGLREAGRESPEMVDLGDVRAGTLVDLSGGRFPELLAPLAKGPERASFGLTLSTLEE